MSQTGLESNVGPLPPTAAPHPCGTRPGWTISEIGHPDPRSWWNTEALPRLHRSARRHDFPPGYLLALQIFTDRYDVPLLGRTRAVFRTGTGHVIKVPHTWDGIDANYTEADASQQTRFSIPVTPTDILTGPDLPATIAESLDGEIAWITRAAKSPSPSSRTTANTPTGSRPSTAPRSATFPTAPSSPTTSDCSSQSLPPESRVCPAALPCLVGPFPTDRFH